MPIFRQLGLVFVHIPKNAGRSIEAALLGSSGTPDDGRRGLVNRAATFISRESASGFAGEFLIGSLDVTLAAQHLTYVEMEMLGLLPAQPFRSFAVVRNPYDRALSSVIHFARGSWVTEPNEQARQAGFEHALASWLDRPLGDHNDRAHRRAQIDFVRDRTGSVAVDHVLRFEALSAGFAELIKEVPGANASLAHRGDSGRSRKYQDYFNANARALVETEFGDDISAFQYEF